ncbi:uncharacterized protein LOC106717141 isoform X1 [Papilio machaon]|uniref:uncharacterized protein LOC106717141 isoform X1 n=1 Tax=Papilio machaon TaxID=76193 RepID=UPI0006EAE8D2|nr:uncharacterized protein LOC106717141 isoform X1 [Papilio machaon]
MLKRTFHDLIEIKKKVAKLEKSKPEKSTKKRRRIIAISSSSEEEPSDTQSKCLERKDAPLPAVPSAEKPDKGKSSARPTSRHKPSDAKASRGGNKDPKSRTGIQIQDRFWRNITRNFLTIATADLLMYINHFHFIFY